MTSRTALRLFVALYPPIQAAGEMLSACTAMSLPTHRVTPVGQVHLTLFFIGDTDTRQLEDVLQSVRRSASGIGAITLSPRVLVSLPEYGPPRLIALETDAPANLRELQRRLSHRLSRRPHRGNERFTPHLTLCRYATPGGEIISRPVSIPPFTTSGVALVESVLRPTGADHRVVERVPLA